jgi:tRNA threonylcarbamoyl adenosine modification protein YeaZ
MSALSPMKILALEFSSYERSVALARMDAANAVEILSVVKDTDFRSVTGLALIDRAVKQAGVTPTDISHLIVGLGPGSYTGIRSAIAIAQGWQLGRAVQVIGISSALCLAEEARRGDVRGEVTLVFDAQRGDVYIQSYRLDSEVSRELEPLRIIPRSEIPSGRKVIGPEASKFVPGGRDLSPSAETLATLVNVGAAAPAEHLEPIYLRETTFVKAPPARSIL